MQKWAIGFCCLAFVVSCAWNSSEARPKFPNAFKAQYPDLADAAGDAKCALCHPEKSKKVKNEYGIALGKAIGKKNEKDLDKVKAAMVKIEGEKSSGGESFGDIIKGGNLPN